MPFFCKFCGNPANITTGIICTFLSTSALLPFCLETKPLETVKMTATDEINVALAQEVVLVNVIDPEIVITDLAIAKCHQCDVLAQG